MATYSLESVLQSVFDEFCTSPSADQLQCMSEVIANGDFDEPPSWQSDDIEDWIRSRLSSQDWYEGLVDEEMVAWDGAISALFEHTEFDLQAHGFHCAVSDMFITMADKAFEKRNEQAVIRQFWPFRYFDTYHAGVEPVDQIYFPCHALLTNEQVATLLGEVAEYDRLLEELAQNSPDWVEHWRPQIDEDLKEALPALREIVEQGRMWYSRFDF